MQTIEWKSKPLGSVIANSLAAGRFGSYSPRCAECGSPRGEKPIEVIADFAGWHLGWRKYDCKCHGTEARVVLSRDTHHLQYQTHPVC